MACLRMVTTYPSLSIVLVDRDCVHDHIAREALNQKIDMSDFYRMFLIPGME